MFLGTGWLVGGGGTKHFISFEGGGIKYFPMLLGGVAKFYGRILEYPPPPSTHTLWPVPNSGMMTKLWVIKLWVTCPFHGLFLYHVCNWDVHGSSSVRLHILLCSSKAYNVAEGLLQHNPDFPAGHLQNAWVGLLSWKDIHNGLAGLPAILGHTNAFNNILSWLKVAIWTDTILRDAKIMYSFSCIAWAACLLVLT